MSNNLESIAVDVRLARTAYGASKLHFTDDTLGGVGFCGVKSLEIRTASVGYRPSEALRIVGVFGKGACSKCVKVLGKWVEELHG